MGSERDLDPDDDIHTEAWIDEAHQVDLRQEAAREKEEERREEAESIRDAPSLANIIRAGDVEAFARVIEFYADDLAGIARRLMGNAHDASDVVNDAWIKAWENREQLRGDNPRPWLRRIVENLAFSRLRKSSREIPFSALDKSSGPDDGDGESGSFEERIRDESPNDPAAIAESAEAVAAVRRAIHALPDRMQEVVRMLALEGRSVSEVAEDLGIREQTVRNYHARAKELLRKTLAGVEP